MPMTEEQLSAMIDAAVREAVERTASELTAKHEAETEGLRRKRDELLNKAAEGEGKGHHADMAIALALAYFASENLLPGFTGEGQLENYW